MTMIDSRLDPNYQLTRQFKDCPFHQGLHRFISRNRASPMWHIDIHGKKDRQHDGDIDMGSEALRVYASADEYVRFVKPMVQFLEKHLNKLFYGKMIKVYPVKVNPDAQLNGYWGN